MKLSPQWIREFVDVPVDNVLLAEDLTGIGIAVEGVFGAGVNTVFEMEIGTNRPDAMNHYGVAREAAALYGVELKAIGTSAAKAVSLKAPNGTTEVVPFPSVPPRSSSSEARTLTSRTTSATASGSSESDPFQIDIDDSEGCARYTAQIVRGVKITASPEHIASRLALVDQRSINNAADASNYTLWEMGHPTHAFDLDLWRSLVSWAASTR